MKITITQTTKYLYFTMLVIAGAVGVIHSIDYGQEGWLLALPSTLLMAYGFVMVIKTDVDGYYLNEVRNERRGS